MAAFMRTELAWSVNGAAGVCCGPCRTLQDACAVLGGVCFIRRAFAAPNAPILGPIQFVPEHALAADDALVHGVPLRAITHVHGQLLVVDAVPRMFQCDARGRELDPAAAVAQIQIQD